MNDFIKMRDDDSVKANTDSDVTLLLEGSYPYVRGGMSNWVHQLITGLPNIRFAGIFLGGRRADYDQPHYEKPENLVHFEEHYIMDPRRGDSPSARKGNTEAFELNDAFHQALKSHEGTQAGRLLSEVAKLLGNAGGLNRSDFLYSQASWNQIRTYYERYCTHPSFVDYFWTVRTIHAPLFDLIEIARRLPATGLLHSASTGYAGFVGALAHYMHNLPLVLTEHGIYTKERRIDLAQADWIRDAENAMEATLEQDVSYFREMWIRFFEGIGHLVYAASNPILTLYEDNRQRQIRDGAPEERTRVVPNGISLERYRPLRQKRPERIPPVLALIGRVVPIKDIKTFIRAMRTIYSHLPDSQGWVVGPIEEDPEYANECQTLARDLGLEGCVSFLGFRKLDEILPQIGLNVLTSISEAQPLVLMEGFAAGVPAVTTDVGSCREMLLGSHADDRALGAAGRLVPIANPGVFAESALELLSSPQQWYAAQQAGIQRAEKYYSESLMFERYLGIYNRVSSRALLHDEAYTIPGAYGEVK